MTNYEIYSEVCKVANCDPYQSSIWKYHLTELILKRPGCCDRYNKLSTLRHQEEQLKNILDEWWDG